MECIRPLSSSPADFQAAYRKAREAWCEGVRDAIFPHGTFQLARVHGVTVALAPG